jgi:hypothetical protein
MSKYYFDQKSFDVLSNTAKCALSFRFKDGNFVVINQLFSGSALKNAFTYDFRVYTIPEVREALAEAGFKQTFIWWAQTGNQASHQGGSDDESDAEKDTNNDGIFEYERIDHQKLVQGAHAWNAYVVACL